MPSQNIQKTLILVQLAYCLKQTTLNRTLNQYYSREYKPKISMYFIFRSLVDCLFLYGWHSVTFYMLWKERRL